MPRWNKARGLARLNRMRTVKLVLALIGSLVVIVTCAPLLWALRQDRHERNVLDVGDDYPYDDNDPGEDVDDEQPDVDDEQPDVDDTFRCYGCERVCGPYGCDCCDDATDYTHDADHGGEA